MRSITARLALLAALLVSLVVPAMASATATPEQISNALEQRRHLPQRPAERKRRNPRLRRRLVADLVRRRRQSPRPTSTKPAKKPATLAAGTKASSARSAGPAKAAVATDFERGALDRLRGRDRPGPRLEAPEPDRQGRLLLPAGEPGLLRRNLQRDGLRAAGPGRREDDRAASSACPQVVLEQAITAVESQPAHRRRLDLAESRGQRSGAEKRVRTGHDRRRDGGALRRRRPQHRTKRSSRRRNTSSRSSSNRPAPSNPNSATTPTPTPGRSTG